MSKSDNSIKFYFFGPGVGESIIINFPDGKWGVVDCYQRENGYGTISFLKEKGVNKLSFFCHTHPHEDHYMGASSLITLFSGRIERIWRHPGFSTKDIAARILASAKVRHRNFNDPEAEYISNEYVALMKAIEKEKLVISPDSYRRISCTAELLASRNYKIYAIGPQSGILDSLESRLKDLLPTEGKLLFNEEGGEFLNRLSVILQIKFGSAQVFLLADAQGKNVHIHSSIRKCEVVKVAHHGSCNGLCSGKITNAKEKEYYIKHALITPYRRSRIPSKEMVKKYSESCDNLKLTSCGNIEKKSIAFLGLISAYSVNQMNSWIGMKVTQKGKVTNIKT